MVDVEEMTTNGVMRIFLLGWVVLLLTACGGGADGAAEAEVERLSLPVGAEMRREGGSLRLLSGESVVQVDGGRLWAVAPGEARLVDGAGVEFTVVVPEPDRLELTLAPPLTGEGWWWLGESREVRLWAVTADERYDVSDEVRWFFGRGLSASAGVVTAVTLGEATIEAHWQGERRSLTVDVQPAPDPVVSWRLQGETDGWAAGDTRRFVLIARHRSGREVVPSVVDTARLRLSANVELVDVVAGALHLRAVAAGEGRLFWDGDEIGRWEIAPPYWVSLELARVDDGPEPVAVGDRLCLAVTGVNSLGETGRIQTVTWQVDPPLLERLGGDCFRVKVAGNTVVTAQMGTLSAELALNLRAPRLVALELGLDDPAILPGEGVAIRVVERYSDDTTVAPANLSWEIEDTSVVALGEAGLEAVAPGTTRIRASNGALWSEWVTVAVAEGVVIEPETLSLAAGSEGRLDAYARYPDRQVPLSDAVQWRSANSEVVSVDAGVVFAVSPGAVTVDTIPAAQQPANVEVTPRSEYRGAGPHRLEAGEFYLDPAGNRMAAVAVRDLGAATLVTPRLAQVPLGSSLVVSPRAGGDGACFNQALRDGPLACSTFTDAAGELVITVVIPGPQLTSGVDLTIRSGGFVDEGVGPDGPLSLTLGLPHEGTVVNGGQSHYRISLSGEARYRLLAEPLEGGGATVVMYGISSAEGDCQGNLSLPQDCTFLPENVGTTQVDLLVSQWAASPEGGSRYRLTIERLSP